VKIRYSRPIPDHANIKEVTFKKERTGEWFICFGLETDDADLPEKPDVDSLDASNSVGIDLGIQNYIHTSDGKTVDWLNLEEDYERLRREQRKLECTERHGQLHKRWETVWRPLRDHDSIVRRHRRGPERTDRDRRYGRRQWNNLPVTLNWPRGRGRLPRQERRPTYLVVSSPLTPKLACTF